MVLAQNQCQKSVSLFFVPVTHYCFWLMNNESEDVIILFSNYIYDCFKLRDVLQYSLI